MTKVDDELPKYYERFRTDALKLRDEWNTKFIQLQDLINLKSKAISVREDHQDLVFHINVINVAKKWYTDLEGEVSSCENSITSLVTPLKEVISAEIENGSDSEYPYELSSILHELEMVYKNWEASRDGYVTIFKKEKRKLDQAKTTLSASLTIVNEEVKIKSWYWLT